MLTDVCYKRHHPAKLQLNLLNRIKQPADTLTIPTQLHPIVSALTGSEGLTGENQIPRII